MRRSKAARRALPDQSLLLGRQQLLVELLARARPDARDLAAALGQHVGHRLQTVDQGLVKQARLDIIRSDLEKEMDAAVQFAVDEEIIPGINLPAVDG